MRIWDCHSHVRADETGPFVLEQMDAAGIERVNLFSRVRFSLAHIGWPWVDECIAVFGRFRAAAGYKTGASQMWIDTCRGTPDAWREEALRKAVPFCGVERLMFGVDGTPSNMPSQAPVHAAKDLALLRDVIGLSQEQIETFFWGACEGFWGR